MYSCSELTESGDRIIGVFVLTGLLPLSCFLFCRDKCMHQPLALTDIKDQP